MNEIFSSDLRKRIDEMNNDPELKEIR